LNISEANNRNFNLDLSLEFTNPPTPKTGRRDILKNPRSTGSSGQDQYHRYRDQFDFNRRESDLSIQSRQTLDGASEASWHIKAKEEIMEKLGVS